MDDERSELLLLRAMAREWLEWERELGGPGFRDAPSGFASPSVRATFAADDGSSPTFPGTIAAASMTTSPGTIAAPPEGAVEAPALADEAASERRRRLDVVAARAASCTACRLHQGRTHSVFARGNPSADIVFIGEGPGFHEDQSGVPFVGPAGQLLDKMIAAMGSKPSDVYVCNVVKCRPPDNRTPLPEEALTCAPFLVEQLDLVAPKVIVALGRCAAENLGLARPGANGWRGAWGTWRGIPVMPTYHPAFLLRSPEFKRTVWEDLQKVMAHLGRPTARP